jgi:hypothetical protein
MIKISEGRVWMINLKINQIRNLGLLFLAEVSIYLERQRLLLQNVQNQRQYKCRNNNVYQLRSVKRYLYFPSKYFLKITNMRAHIRDTLLYVITPETATTNEK